MKILLLGKSGMLGSCFLKRLAGSEDFETYAFSKEELDITDFSKLETVFERIKPNFVINCAAYTAVDDCETNKELAFKLNEQAPGKIAKACKKVGAVLVHFSTDYVFDGQKAEGYKEDDIPHPINVYGESKLKGEQMVAQELNQYYIVRSSWLFGLNGKNFVDTMIRLSREIKELKVVGDQIGCPTYTKDLCEAVIENFLDPYIADLPRQHELNLPERKKSKTKLDFGIYHITNSGSGSWFEFAKKIFELAKIDVKVEKITSEQFKRPAKRPNYSILLNTKTESLRSWQEALKAYLDIAI